MVLEGFFEKFGNHVSQMQCPAKMNSRASGGRHENCMPGQKNANHFPYYVVKYRESGSKYFPCKYMEVL